MGMAQDSGGGGPALVLDDAGTTGEGGRPDGGGASSDATSGRDAGPAEAGGPTVLDPSVPTPSHDCRTDTSINCISVAGTYNGNRIDEFCNNPAGLSVIVHAGKWVIGCDNTNPVGTAVIYVPIQKPGTFSETATAGSSQAMEFEFSADTTTSIALFTANLVRAELAGTIAAPSATDRVVTGTFHGEWSMPAAGCQGTYGSPCASANINVTFRTEGRYGSCLSNSDCAAPQTCDSVGFFCM
jgi:hypothetical protein